MNILGIIQDTHSEAFGQCRGLLPFNGHTFLEEIRRRLDRVAQIDRVVLITSDNSRDDRLADFASSLGLEIHRGDAKDVLARTMLPIRLHNPDHIVRVSGSSPFLDSAHLEYMIALHLDQDADLTTCECRESIIQGLGAEVVRAAALSRIVSLPLTAFQREFQTQYIKQNRDRFVVVEAHSPLSRPAYSLSVGNRRDYVLVKEVAKLLDGNADERRIVDLLDANPHLVEINAEPERAYEVGLDKLFLFPEKLAALGTVMRGEAPLDLSYPISVELSLTDACNQECIWCSDMGLRAREQAVMKRETVFDLVDDLHSGGTHGIVIEGGGEPTLHPNFAEIVDYIHKKGMGIGLITNGVLSIPARTLQRLEWVRVSLDAGCSREYCDLKGFDNFDRVMNNINAMTGVCPVVGVGYVLTNRNADNLESLIFQLQKANVSYLQIRPVVDHPELAHEGDVSHLQSFTYEQFPIMLDALKENACGGNAGLSCLAHSLTSVISSAGNVYLCGRLNIHDRFEPMGNINEQPFGDIWRGAKRKAQAEAAAHPEFCRIHCPQCRITKFNKALNKLVQIKTKHFI